MRAVLRLALAGVITATTLTTLTATAALAEAVADVKVNEVESNGDTFDWIEVINTGAAPVEISGFVVKDNDDTHAITVAAGTTVPAGGYAAINTDDSTVTGNFGLGGADSARLFAW